MSAEQGWNKVFSPRSKANPEPIIQSMFEYIDDEGRHA